MLDPTTHTALRIAGQRWKYAAARATAIRDQLGISETQWAQMLDVLIDQPGPGCLSDVGAAAQAVAGGAVRSACERVDAVFCAMADKMAYMRPVFAVLSVTTSSLTRKRSLVQTQYRPPF